jgi:hypothetical protein
MEADNQATNDEAISSPSRASSRDAWPDLLLPVAVLFITTSLLASGISAQLTGSQGADRFPIVKNDKVGFIDGNGREVMAPQFGDAGDAARLRERPANVGGADGWG